MCPACPIIDRDFTKKAINHRVTNYQLIVKHILKIFSVYIVTMAIGQEKDGWTFTRAEATLGISQRGLECLSFNLGGSGSLKFSSKSHFLAFSLFQNFRGNGRSPSNTTTEEDIVLIGGENSIPSIIFNIFHPFCVLDTLYPWPFVETFYLCPLIRDILSLPIY